MKCMGTVFLAVLLIHFGAIACEPGYYQDTGGQCTACPSDSYCADGISASPCPDVEPVIDTANWLADVKITSIVYVSNAAISIQRCQVLIWVEDSRTKGHFYAQYSPATGKYSLLGAWGYATAKPGYYLSDPANCGTYAYYHQISACAAGGYCPGKDWVLCHQGNKAQVHTQTFGLEICPDNTYSNAGASACTACPAKTGNNINTLAGHSGSASCLSLCGAGATKLHAGSYEFNMWSNGQCTTPALRIGLSGGTCCVNLQTGTASGALHIQTNGTTYHTVN